MKFEGGCYCRKIRYVADGEPRLKAQCHCRECRYITGGAPNMFMLVAPQGFRYTSGEPRKFSRSDLESPVTREFCGECGTHLATRRLGLPLIILKVGTLDDPSLFGAPQMAIYTVDKQPFHVLPESLQTFERLARAGPKKRGGSRQTLLCHDTANPDPTARSSRDESPAALLA